MTARSTHQTGIIQIFELFLHSERVSATTRHSAHQLLLATLKKQKDLNDWSHTQVSSSNQTKPDKSNITQEETGLISTSIQTTSPSYSIGNLSPAQLIQKFLSSYPPYETAILFQLWQLALVTSDCSPATAKNYRSDIRQFIEFYRQTRVEALLKKPKVLSFLKSRAATQSQATISRQLSSIGQFIRFAKEQGWISYNISWLDNLAGEVLQDQVNSNSDSISHQASSELKSSSISPKPPTPTDLVKEYSLMALMRRFGRSKPKIKHALTINPKDLNDQPSQTNNFPGLWQLPILNKTNQSAAITSRSNRSLADVAYLHSVQNSWHPSLSAVTESLLAQSRQRWLPWLSLGFALLAVLGIGYFGYQQLGKTADPTLAYPTALTRPNRSFSFQGRLTDAAKNPIVSETNMQFKLFTVATGGTAVWSSGVCQVDPDQDGIFSTNLGSDCGSEIPASVFSENANVWLEVTVESETLLPRQPIKTVAYALNSETLQGYPASASAVENTVLVMNNNGELVLGNTSPVIKSTGESFAIEAQTMTIRTSTGSDGDIVLDPDGLGDLIILGNLDAQAAATISGNFRVKGTSVFDNYLSAPGATLSATYAGGTPLTLRAGPSATADILRWQTSTGSTLGVIDKSGNVGIGTTGPGGKLDLRLDSGDSTTKPLVIGKGTTDYVTILNNGNVGIGTTSPDFKLQVDGTIAPETTDQDLGSTALRWDLFANTINADDAVTFSNLSAGGVVKAGSGTGLLTVGSVSLTSEVTGILPIANGGTNTSSIGSAGSVAYSTGTAYGFSGVGTAGYLLTSGGSGAPTWTDPASVGTNYWSLANQGLSPTNQSLNLYIGGNSTASAKFLADGATGQGYFAGNVGIGSTAPAAKLDVAGRIWQTGTGYSIFIGEQAGNVDDLTSNHNVFVGYRAGLNNITGSFNTVLGSQALYSGNNSWRNTAIGYQALYTTGGNNNTAIGYQALYSNNGGYANTAFGASALFSTNNGNSNTSVGEASLYYSTDGIRNTVIGYRAGGFGTGTTFGSANQNTIIGYQAGYNLGGGDVGNVYLGYQAGYNETGSNKLYIENSDSSSPLIWGDFSTDTLAFNANVGIGTTTPSQKLHVYRSTDGPPVRFEDANGYCEINPTSTAWTCTSDKRLKKDINSLSTSSALDKLLNLRPVSFEWNNQKSDTKRFGFIAQEVEPLFPELVSTDKDGMKSVAYGSFTPFIISGIQELQKQLTSLSQTPTSLAAINTSLSLDQFGQLTIVGSDESSYQLANAVTATPVTNRLAAFTQTITAIIEAGLTRTRQLVVTGQAQIANLSVANLSIGDQSMRDYVASIIQEVQPTATPVIMEVTPTPSQIPSQLAVNTLTTTTLQADSLQVAYQTKLGSLMVDKDATVAGELTTTDLTASSARIAALEAGIAQMQEVRATTAILSQATISGTLYADTIANLDKQIATAIKQPSLIDIILGQTSNNNEDLAVLKRLVDTAVTTASAAAQLDQSIADLSLNDDDIVITGQAAFINQYLKVNGVAYVSDSLGVGNLLKVGKRLDLTDTYLAFHVDPSNSDDLNVFSIQPSGKGVLSLMAGLLTLDETGTVTIVGNLKVAGDVQIRGTLLSNLIESNDPTQPVRIKVAGASTEIPNEQTSNTPETNPLDSSIPTSPNVGNLGSRFEIIGDLGQAVATVSGQGKISLTGGINIDSDSLVRPDVQGTATNPDQLTQSSVKTTGRATLPAGNNQLIIRNPNITSESLVYLTPLGSTNNQVLYVKQTSPAVTAPPTPTNPYPTPTQEAYFVVGLDAPAKADITFTWWIVN